MLDGFVIQDLRFCVELSDRGHGSGYVDYYAVPPADIDLACDYCYGSYCDCDFAALSGCVALALQVP